MKLKVEMDQIIWLDFSKERKKIRTVCSASIIWGNNHHIHLNNIQMNKKVN